MNDPRLEDIELFGWLGEDELGSGEVGIKQGLCPAGYVPLVGINQEKMECFRKAMQEQANKYGKPINLCRYHIIEVLETVYPNSMKN